MQSESVKKRDMEIQRLKQEMEEASTSHDTQLAAIRKKQKDAMDEMNEQMEQINKVKTR